MKNKIKEVRKSKGIKQNQLAEMLGVTPSTVAQYESGNHNTKIETLEKVASALGCSIVDLIDKSDYENAPQEEKRQVLDIAFDEAKVQVNRATDIVSAAGYKWVLPDQEDGAIHLVDKKTNIEYAVPDEAFTAAIDSSAAFIEFNFKKMMESAKVVSNGRKTEER